MTYLLAYLVFLALGLALMAGAKIASGDREHE